MDEQHQQVRLLLARAADAAGAFEPPPVETLTNRRRPSRTRSVVTVAAAAVVVLALAVGLSVRGGHDVRTTATPPATKSPTLSLPGPTGPAVPVSALRDYRWSALPAAPIAVRSGAASAWTGQVLIVWGGQTAGGQLRNDGATYDPTSRKWTTLPTAPLRARTSALSAWVGDSFIVWGGNDDSNGHHASDGARYDPRAGVWASLPAAPVSSYDWASLVVAGNEVVLLSTPRADQRVIHADAYNPVSNTWRSLPDLVTPLDHQVFVVTALGLGDTVLVWSAWSHTTREPGDSTTTVSGVSGVDTYALDTKATAWSPVALEPDRGREATQPVWTGRQILLPNEDVYCGPCSHPISLDNPGVAIDPRTGSRTPIPSGPLSTGFVDYYWTGSALLALDISTEMSGPGHSMSPGDTAAWDPDTNRWTRLSGTTINGDAGGAVTAWTGTRLLVWGIGAAHGTSPDAAPGLQFAPARATASNGRGAS